MDRHFVYYIDRGVELVYTHFHTFEEATRVAKIIGGHTNSIYK